MTASGDHGLADQLEAVEHADGREHVRGVGALPAARLEQSTSLADVQQPAEQPLLGAAGQQA
jgi:hypothetical protein